MGESSMKLMPEQAVILIAQLDKEFKTFEENCSLNRKAWERIQQGADDELAEITDELRGFRHVFRSVYENRIDPDRISLIQKKIPRMQKLFSAAHRSYCDTISSLTASQ